MKSVKKTEDKVLANKITKETKRIKAISKKNT